MPKLNVPRILIAGASSGAGKSLLTLGLVYELRRRGMSVSVCSTNANLGMSVVFRRIAGRYVRCLDPRILSPSQIVEGLYQASIGADIVLIDGSAALFDGVTPGRLDASDAEVAALTRTPTLLVMDCSHVGSSAAAALKGYLHFAQGFDLVGLIANRVDPDDASIIGQLRDRHYYEEVMQGMRLPALVGGVSEAQFDVPDLPHRVTQEFNLGALPRQFFVGLNSLVNSSIDVDNLIALAGQAPEVDAPEATPPMVGRQSRIAVTDDVCFGLCFQDNLDLLRYHGAELVSFSPVADQSFPKDIGGLYLTGGYLDEYGADLAANTVVMEGIRDFVGRGGALYAEGAGLAYLCQRYKLSSSNKIFHGCGVIPATAENQDEFFSLCDGATIEDSVVGNSGSLIKGLTTNRWKFTQEFPILKTMQIGGSYQRSSGEGFAPTANSFSTFCFWHWGSCPEFAPCFVDASRTIV